MSGRILIVDDVATNRIVMKVKLAAARYDVVPAASGAEALDIARAGGIDLIIMDMKMPGMSGAQATATLRTDMATADIPVILVTANEDAEARMQGLSAGADDFLSKPVDEIALLARVRSLLRTREEQRDYEARTDGLLEMSQPMPGMGERGQTGFVARHAAQGEGRIAIIAGAGVGAGAGSSWLGKQRLTLEPMFREPITVMGRDATLALAGDTVPDLFVIDADGDGRNDGLRLMSELRSRTASRHAAFIVVLPSGDSERAANALDLGAADVVYHPVPADELAMRIRTQLARKRRADRMRDTLDTGLRLAVIDPLTGLHNRRYGLHHLDRVATRCRAQGVRSGIVMIDLDHFKEINDTHGHPVGDRVLSQVAQALKDKLRGEDLIARIGGEEFLAILPDTGLEEVRSVAERLRAAIAALRLPLPEGEELRLTISLGIAMLEDRDDCVEHAVHSVDRALYRAKEAGRNRAHVAVE